MSNTMIRLKAAALFGAVAVGFVAFGDYYKDWTATTDAYWEDDSSWSTGEGNIIDYRIGNSGSVVKFRSAVEESDNITVLHYNGEHSFVADNATYGIKKPNAPLDVKAPWWYSGSPVLTIKNGTYQFASVNIWTDTTQGGTPGLVLAGGTLKTAYVAGSGGILTLNGGTLEFDKNDYTADYTIINVPLTVGANGGTIDTGSGENNYRLAVTSTLSGSGLITKTGARPLSFTGDVSGFNGTITVADDAGAVKVGETTIGPGDTVSFGNAYVWTGGAGVEDTSWSNGENWRTGTAPNDAEAEVLIPNGAVITLTEDVTIDTMVVNGSVSISGDSEVKNFYFLNIEKGSNNATVTAARIKFRHINGSAGEAVFAPDLMVEQDDTVEFINSADRVNRVFVNQRYVKFTGNLLGSGTVRAYSDVGSNANTQCGFTLASTDNSAFAGTININSNPSQQRDSHSIIASATSSNAVWEVYTSGGQVNGRFFKEAGTAETKKSYYFGALTMRWPRQRDVTQLAENYIELEIGNLNQDSSMWGEGTFGTGSGIRWIAETATLTNAVSNAAYIDVVGGGNLALSASGIPAAINFSEEGGCLVLSDDDDLNASVLAAVSTVAEGATIGFVYDGEAVKTLDLSGKKTLLAGKDIVKRGTGTVYLTGLADVTLGDVTVEEGTLALQHGAKVGTVTVEDGAVFYVDLTGAINGEEVFEYADYVGEGEAEYRNLAEGAAVTIDDEGETTVWTLSRAAKRYTWTGAVSTDYSDSGNWEPAGIPTTDDTVVFTEDATLVPGAVFGSIEFQNDAKISFDFTLGKVGASTTLITLTRPDSDTSSHFVYPGANYISNFSGGVFATTRNATTYTWTGSVDNSWATSGNWAIGTTEVREVPEPEDSVVFPASDAEGFKNWEVTLPWDVYAETVWVNGNTLLSGAHTLKAHTINGAAELRLNNAHLGSNGAELDVYCPLNIMTNTTNYIYLQKFGNSAGQAYIVNLHGSLYGSGVLKADHAGVQGVGVKFFGNNSGFDGTFESSNYNQRDATDMENSTSSSSNAVWNVYTYNNVSDQAFIVHGTDTYYFGALNGGLQMGSAGGSKSPNETVSIEVGARDDVPSSFALASHVNYNKGYDVRKVGNNKMSITGKGWAGGNNVFRLNSLTIAGGTAYIPSLPNEFITFEGKGGILQLGYETKSEEVEVTPAVTDQETGEIITPAETETVYTYPLYDPSALVKNSSGEFGYDDLGTNSTWEAAIDASNVGGFAKYGAGTLTLKEWDSNFEGVVTVWDGTLIVPDGTELVVNPLSAGEITYPNGGDPIDHYCYAPGTVLNGTETADDDLDKQLDVANVAKVDFSNPSPAMLDDLCDDGIFVLAKTSDSSSIPVVGYEKNAIELDMLGEDYEWPAGVEKPKWWNESTKWTVRVLTVKENGKKYTALAVARGEFPFVISVQ